jgi:hypothetical protein
MEGKVGARFCLRIRAYDEKYLLISDGYLPCANYASTDDFTKAPLKMPSLVGQKTQN